MIIKFPKSKQKVEINPFENCEYCDIFMENIDEIKMFLVSVKTIWRGLSDEEREKSIYINLTHSDHIAYASYEQDYLLLPEPINEFLDFYDLEQLEEYALALIERFNIFQEEEDKKRRSIY